VRRETVMDTVARRIEALMRSGELKAGDRLPPEPELARRLAVSRSSLREALKGLHFLGLLKARPGDGTYIQSSLSRVLNQHFQWMLLLREVGHLEIYELRKILEPEAAALAARRATKDDLDRMANALEGMKRDLHQPGLFHIHDIEFHEAFMQASGNVAIRTTMRMLYHATTEARLRVLPLIDNMDNHFGRHERMFRHIYNREPALARKAVLDDLLYAEKLLKQQMNAEHPAAKAALNASDVARSSPRRKVRAALKKS
jgi:GntR family transcriptional regulator, transcriptional repressor for pyruvate dehydrogenase complex